jgi:hypothetical protein
MHMVEDGHVRNAQATQPGFPLPPAAQPPGCLVSSGLSAMEAQWIPVLAGGGLHFYVFL